MTFSVSKTCAPFVCVFISLHASLLFGQFESGTVLGTVHDQSGAPVPGASVTLEDVKTGIDYQLITKSNGEYEFVNERPSTYRVRVSAKGFETAVASTFDLQVNARQRVDLSLQVGQSSQTVTVNDAVELLETDTSSRGQVITPREIVDLPLNGRAYADLAALVPGVARSPLENQTDSSRDASFNINGLRSEYNNFLLDGVDNNAYGTSNQGFSNQVIQPNPDALSEFKVETDNYSAEFGRAPGAVLNAAIKSGSNQFHGELWEFNRNTVFNAEGFFRPVTGNLPFNQNQFGGALGGPIMKDKMFFFADYEGFRRVYHTPLFASLPTAAEDRGIFTTAVENPITRVVYPAGTPIPMTPLAQAVVASLPAPNLPGTSNNYETAPADTTNNDKGDFRYDYFINQKVTAFARYSQGDTSIFSPANIPGPDGGNANGNVYVNSKQGVLGTTWTINSTSVLEARLGVDYMQGGKTPATLGQSTSGFTVPNLPTGASLAGGLFSINLSDLSQLGRQSSNPQYQYPFVMDPKVNFTRILGRHSLKSGFEYQAIDTQVSDFHPQYGSENYQGLFSDPTYLTNPSSINGLSGAKQAIYSWADFLFGAPSHYELDNNPVAHLRQRMYFAYLQDDWKVSDKLTLNLGVRYEFATPQYEANNKLANFDPATDSLIYASGGSLYNRALVHPDPNNWAPRVGLAYQAAPNTVIRSGFGISYVQFNRLGGENLLAYNGPNVVDAFIDQVPKQGICTSTSAAPGACFRTTEQGFPNNFASPSSFNPAITEVRYIPGDNRTGYVESWHFDVQQQLAHNYLFDIAYVGNHSVGTTILADENQAVPNLLGQNLSVNARRPYAGFTTIEVSYDGGFSSYDALQTKLEKRYSTGLYFINSFTWSKSIDNAPGHLENYDGDNSRVNIYDTQANRGLSSYNQPINDTLSVLYDIPFGKGRRFNTQNKAIDMVAGGWGVDLVNTESSGLPINITYNPSTQGQVSTLDTYQPNLVSGVSLYRNSGNPVYYLNPAAFTLPSYTAPFGNAGRNIAKLPFFSELDFGLHKNFALWSESKYIQFRAEAFNLLNKTNFSPSGLTLTTNSSSYGQFTSTFPARQLQLALKLYF
jgi:hypothetical protein